MSLCCWGLRARQKFTARLELRPLPRPEPMAEILLDRCGQVFELVEGAQCTELCTTLEHIANAPVFPPEISGTFRRAVPEEALDPGVLRFFRLDGPADRERLGRALRRDLVFPGAAKLKLDQWEDGLVIMAVLAGGAEVRVATVPWV